MCNIHNIYEGQVDCYICNQNKAEKNARLEAFVLRFLNPEDLGYTVNEALRDEAREALGIPRVNVKV